MGMLGSMFSPTKNPVAQAVHKVQGKVHDKLGLPQAPLPTGDPRKDFSAIQQSLSKKKNKQGGNTLLTEPETTAGTLLT